MDKLTDIGGRCPHCRQEENWLVVHSRKDHFDDDTTHYVVECQTVSDGEFCGTEKEKSLREEKHYSHWESHLQYY